MSGPSRVLICRTCPRYEAAPRGAPTAGRRLGLDGKAMGRVRGTSVRAVNCLAGCKHPCNAAIEAPGKLRLRFSRLTPDDLDALFAVVEIHAASVDGDIGEADLPAALRDKLTARSPSGIGA